MKTIKDAVEHFGGVWPEDAACIIILEDGRIGYLKAGEVFCGSGEVTYIYKTTFKDYVAAYNTGYDKALSETNKEQKMEKQKYKSAPVTNMDIWDLGKAVDNNGKFYDMENNKIFIENVLLKTVSVGHLAISNQLLNGFITTRHPIPWYEVEGVFPCLVRDGIGVVKLLDNAGDFAHFDYVTPLSPTEAAEYGVE
jgi:hypothetical protein